ncbi:MFS transporter [Pseudonocardia sp. N23]|uniref:MFS transporter n=1 Tax=Pseudonocardia sp. N23 TaxID=1987376 RepID=UPI000BFC3726|nr:MFS transporter [Pseudonocardia sp. N23]GAY07165.1 major facilitator superfamily [Pseudonocardia sp. N23]
MSATAPSAAPPATNPSRRLSRDRTFAAVAAVVVLFMAAAGAPTPLYVVYQQAWGFSKTTLTVVFAVYVLGLLTSLLVAGALSDHIGRRPVLVAAIGLEAVAFVLFLVAGGVPVLLVARALQGLATGAAITALSAALVDNAPTHEPGRAGVVSSVAPVAGLGLGALGAGALVQYAPAPTHLVFVVFLVLLVVAVVAVAFMPETSARVPGALGSLRPVVGVPRRLRAEVIALVPILLASWSLGGLFFSLGPSVAAEVLGLHNHLVGGLVVVLLCAPGALTSLLLRSWPLERLLTLAGVFVTVGTAVALVGVDNRLGIVGTLGTVVAGVGFGAAALGTFGTYARIAAPHERGALFAVAYTISYLAFSIPAVAAGFAATSLGLQVATAGYGVMVVTLGVLALVAQRLAGRRRAAAVA